MSICVRADLRESRFPWKRDKCSLPPRNHHLNAIICHDPSALHHAISGWLSPHKSHKYIKLDLIAEPEFRADEDQRRELSCDNFIVIESKTKPEFGTRAGTVLGMMLDTGGRCKRRKSSLYAHAGRLYGESEYTACARLVISTIKFDRSNSSTCVENKQGRI
ncbi:hypothetical protein EVAR_50288_1 [Eumeta japonica]|uniref:Uncharacterized protein n=1 Tax=Eumeta variegata TaxID=151549 RepID=A0A4C1XUR0_EUMVA|nr:hypothetical protein EVAR_50288_1 [Eumeta japonica]